MKKKMLKLILVFLLLLSMASCVNDEKIYNNTIQQLQNEADYCILASTITGGICGNAEDSFPLPNTQTTEKNGKHYIEVSVIEKGKQSINPVITIIQKNKAYIKTEKQYILFLKKSETEANCYYIVDEPSGIIELSKGKLKPINKKMKKMIKTEIGKSYDDYADWFMENYDDIRKYEFPLSITDIAERSDFCVTASTTDNNLRGTKKIGKLYYTRVKVLQKSSGAIPDYITIVQKSRKYITKNNMYILFLKSDDTGKNFYVTDEQNGVILIEKDKKQNLKALNNELQEITEKEIGTDYVDFCDWFQKFYPGQTS